MAENFNIVFVPNSYGTFLGNVLFIGNNASKCKLYHDVITSDTYDMDWMAREDASLHKLYPNLDLWTNTVIESWCIEDLNYKFKNKVIFISCDTESDWHGLDQRRPYINNGMQDEKLFKIRFLWHRELHKCIKKNHTEYYNFPFSSFRDTNLFLDEINKVAKYLQMEDLRIDEIDKLHSALLKCEKRQLVLSKIHGKKLYASRLPKDFKEKNPSYSGNKAYMGHTEK